jgi:radical SAM protein with 4Fe4S-binding SPASM domain
LDFWRFSNSRHQDWRHIRLSRQSGKENGQQWAITKKMSYTKQKPFLRRILDTRSKKSFAFHFMLNSMAGQKLFLYNPVLPRVINISFHERTCPFKCRMCPFHEPTTREIYTNKSEMAFSTLQNIVRNVPNDPYYSFDMSAIGETLEFKPISEYISYMKKEKPLVNTIISTNGLLLTEQLFKDLVKSGLDTIQISLFAENPANHEFITGTKTYDKICDNLLAVSAIRRELKSKKPFLQAFMIEAKETQEHSRHFQEKWSKYVDQAFIRPIYNAGRTIEGLTPAYEESISAERYPCITPWYSTAIRSNGDVLACYMFHWYKETKDSMVIGNINDSSLADLWRMQLFHHFREAHLRQHLDPYPVCANCNTWAGYTNIWRKHKEIYEYDKISYRDFLKRPPAHRGG